MTKKSKTPWAIFINFLFKYKFALLLLLLLLLIVVPPFFKNELIRNILIYGFITLNLLASVFILKNMKRRKYFFGYIIFVLLAILLNWLNFTIVYFEYTYVLRLVFIIILFTTIFINIFKEFEIRGEANLDFIFGAIAGFVVLGLIATFFALIIEFCYPGSFSIPQNQNPFTDYVYFTFITLTTVGYGDFLPLSDQGRMFSMLVALAGQLYLTIIIGFIVGRVLSNKSK